MGKKYKNTFLFICLCHEEMFEKEYTQIIFYLSIL